MSFPTLNPVTLLLALIPLLLILLLDASKPLIRRNGHPIPKAPQTLPLLGNALLFLRPRHNLLSYLTRVEATHPHQTLQISVPTVGQGVLISAPRNLDHVFRSPHVFSKGSFVKSRSWDLFGHGIINEDGELWKKQRKAGLAFLSAGNLRVLTEVALPRYLREAREVLRARSRKRRYPKTVFPADLQAVFHGVTTRLMGRMAYGMEMSAEDEFTRAFEYASGKTAERFQNPLWRVTEFLFGWKFRKALAVVKAHGKKIVDQAISARGRQKEKSLEDTDLDEISGSLIHSLLDSIGDEQLVADAALNYLSAGRDTTAQALTWTFYLLTLDENNWECDKKNVTKKIRKEMKQILADAGLPTTTQDIDPRLFTPTSAPYILAVFYEALRLYPPIPIEIKQVTQPTTLPDGTFLPKDAVVMWSPWSMNRSTKTWGEDASEFNPDRWLTTAPDSTKRQFVNKSAAEFPVFNGGPRICLGKKMAELMAVQTIAAVVWDFSFWPAWGRGEKRSMISLTLPMENGLRVLVSEVYRRERKRKIRESGSDESASERSDEEEEEKEGEDTDEE